MATRDRPIDIPVDGQLIEGTLVGPGTLVPGIMLVHGWDGGQDQYIARAHAIAALGWPVLSVPGVEADDGIATLAEEARRKRWNCVIRSTKS